MPEADLTPAQISILERFLRAGFTFVTLERYARYLGVEKNGFIALLDPGGGKLSVFSQVGYRIGDGIGMLVERGEGKRFVWKDQSAPATPDLLVRYEKFKEELRELLQAKI